MMTRFVGVLFLVACSSLLGGGPDETTVAVQSFCDKVNRLLDGERGNWTATTWKVAGRRFSVTWRPSTPLQRPQDSTTLGAVNK